MTTLISDAGDTGTECGACPRLLNVLSMKTDPGAREGGGWHDDNSAGDRGGAPAGHGNLKPVKPNKLARIDGIVALIMAIGGHMKAPQKRKSVYEERGLLFV